MSAFSSFLSSNSQSLIGAGSSLGTGLLNTLVGINQASINRSFANKQAEEQRAWQEKMWNLSNEYSSPLQVMQRLREAGLNPNLVYDNGAQSQVASFGTGSHGSSPGVVHGQFTDPFVSAMAMKRMQAEIDDIEAAELLKREEARNKREERVGLGIENMFKRDSYQLKLDQMEAENALKLSLADTQESERKKITAEIGYYNQQVDYIKQDIENKKALTEKEIEKMEQDIKNSIETTAAAVVKMKSEARKADADAWLARVEASLKDNPEYRSAFIDKAVAEAYKAIAQGNEEQIKERLAEIAESMRPKPGSAAYTWDKFLDNWLTPLTKSIGNVFGGSAGVTFHK